jgi:hypothetical protein
MEEREQRYGKRKREEIGNGAAAAREEICEKD